MSTFNEELAQYNWDDLKEQIYAKTKSDVERALSKEILSEQDFMALVSPAADNYLEPMAVRSQHFTRQRFGKTIQFYIPLYLTNSCTNHCIYCGFNHSNDIKRIILTDEQIMQEVKAIKEIGDFQHILLVTGENPRDAGVDYIANAIRLVKPYFSSVSIEVQPLKEDEYQTLIAEGLNAVYCYQESYHKENYKIYHPKGMKSKFEWRLDTFERLGRAGIRKIGIGALLGLEDWRTEALMIALHLRYLQKHYWKTKYSISFPRIRPHQGGFQPNVVVSDKDLAQLIFAFRLFDHDIEIALSTRESSDFRDNMAQLGVTSLSAGSKTDPGGYAVYKDELEQFAVNDARTPAQILDIIKHQGYEVVWKDWDIALQSNE